MLEAQKERIYAVSRLRAKGLSESDARRAIEQQATTFRPAFINGKRVTATVTLKELLS